MAIFLVLLGFGLIFFGTGCEESKMTLGDTGDGGGTDFVVDSVVWAEILFALFQHIPCTVWIATCGNYPNVGVLSDWHFGAGWSGNQCGGGYKGVEGSK